jgi:glutamine synthetase
MAKTPQDVLTMIKDNNVKIVDFRFTDYPGLWQHFSVPANEVEADTFEDGLGFDGSSMRGWQSIDESDLLVMPDADTAFVDPFLEVPTLVLFCEIEDPITRDLYTRDPRTVARKAENYLKSSGIADEATFGPEAEFFVFDDIRFDQTNSSGYYYVDSIEGRWNTGRDEQPNLGYKPRYKEGYFPVPPTDSLQDIRSEMVLHMLNCGIKVEAHHHEVATGGQGEIDFRFAPMLSCADQLILYKYIVKNTARKHGKTATFMPKPLFEDNGTGMHVHQSLWKDGEPLFAGSGYAGLSEMALHYAGGILKHAHALLAFVAPTTNSYKRLVPGYEAPVNLAYSRRNRSACIRIPMYSPSPKAKRIEFRCPDPSANPYLAFSAIMMAGFDGVMNRTLPPDPVDQDLYELPEEELRKIGDTPPTLKAALNALEEDNEYLLRGDVFTPDVIDTWIRYKRANELAYMDQRPHPAEFALYYDC